MDSIRERFSALSTELSQMHLNGEAAIAVASVATGALYALRKVWTLGGFHPSPHLTTSDLLQQVRRVSEELGRSDQPSDSEWASGFYLNAAIQRIDAAEDRLAALAWTPRRKQGSQRDAPFGSTARDAGHLKHNPAGISFDRGASFETALESLERVVRAIKLHAESAV